MRLLALRCSAVVALVALSAVVASTLGVNIGRADIDRAIAIGKKSDAERQRFHELYTVRLGSPTVVSLEVISEFRRAVIATEDRERFGDHSFRAPNAEEVLRPWHGRVSVIAHLRFNPHNLLVTMPQYEVTLAGARGTPDIRPVDVVNKPFYVDKTITGADVEAVFDAAAIARAKRTIVVRGPQAQLAAAAFDFASVE